MTTSIRNEPENIMTDLRHALITCDAQGQIVRWSQDAERLFGWTTAETTGRNLFDVIGLDQSTDHSPHVPTGSYCEREWSSSVDCRRHDGTTFRAAVSVVPTLDPGGDVSGLAVSVCDEGRWETVTNALRHARDRYRSLVEALPAATYTLSLDDDPSVASYMSPQIEQITGYPAECWVRDPSFGVTITHPDDVDRLRDALKDHTVSSKPIRVEYRYIRPDGEAVWVRNDAILRRDDSRYWQGFIVDITEQKRMDEALRISEEQFRSAFVDAAIPMAIAETSGMVVKVNQPFCNLLGYTADELLGRNIAEFTHPDDRQDSFAQRHGVLSGKTRAAIFPRRYVHRSGSIVFTLVNLSATRVLNDNRVYVLGQIQDVTEQKHAEDELRRLSDRYQRLIDNANDVIITYDTTGRLTFVNQKFTELSGYDLNETPALNVRDIIHPDDREHVLNTISRRLAGEPVPRNYEFRVLTRTGNTLYVDVNASLIFEDDQIIGIQAFLRDVTDRTLAESALSASEIRFRRLVERSTDVVTLLNREGEITYQSPSAHTILGRASHEMIGETLSSFIHPADRNEVMRAFDALIGNPGSSFNLEYRLSDNHGNWRWIESTARNLLDDDTVNGIVMNSRDTTDRQRANRALAVHNNVLRLLANDRPFSEILDAICHAAESQLDGGTAALILLDPDHECDPHVSASQLSKVNALLQSAALTPLDILGVVDQSGQSFPQITEYPLLDLDEARVSGHCWSIPIIQAKSNNTLGALVIFFERERHPGLVEARVLSETASLAHLALQRHRAEQERREHENLLRLVLNTLPVGVWFADANGQLTMVNSAGEKIWGHARMVDINRYAEYKGWWAESGRRIDSHEWGMSRAIRAGETSINEEIEIESFDGQRKTILHSAVPIRRPDGRIAGAVVVNHDISDRKALEQRLIDQALHDSLTGLPNRKLLLDRLEHALERAARNRTHVAVVFLDLDNLKVINDSLGHGVGDALIIETARRLSRGLRKSDTVARLGGDEYIIMIEDIDEVTDALRVVQTIESLLAVPFELAGRTVHVTASIGLALSRAEGTQPEEIIRDADTAMYRAKRDGRAQHAVFDPQMHHETLQRLEIEQDLRAAVDAGELRVQYQPQYRLDDGRICGFEALVRWQHPEKGLIPPDQFITIAEETGIIVPLGRWVLHEASVQARVWLEDGSAGDDFSVCVNLSARQFRDPDLLADVVRTLERTGLSPRHLTLEMTETTIMDDPDRASDVVDQLHRLGVQLAIDDFGTGYSSLAHLTRFSFDFLKMDRSFVESLRDIETDSVLISSMVQLGHAMSMEIVGEGIESDAQLEALRRLGCDIVQGFHLCPPVDAAQAASILMDNRCPG